MTTRIFKLRLETDKADRLFNIADNLNSSASELVRDKIDEIITNGISPELKTRAIKMTEELRGPFMFVKNKIGIGRAEKERAIREALALKIEKCFNLKNESRNL